MGFLRKAKEAMCLLKSEIAFGEAVPQFIRSNAEFMQLWRGVKGRTLVDVNRIFLLWQFAKHALSISGDVAEIGVYKGGTAKVIASVFHKSIKTVHLFDTFCGLPEISSKKNSTKHVEQGLFGNLSLDAVKNFLREFNNVEFHIGIFPNSGKLVIKSKFCFVHIDVDLYQSTKDCLEFFYHKMTSGGIIISDDYGSPRTPGVKKAIDNFLEDKKEFPITTAGYQCAIIKL